MNRILITTQPLARARRTILILVALLLISGISHSYNMFQWPYFENDEGTYMSQAHALMTEGKLAHYTYWYDHAPAGWMLIGIWGQVAEPFTGFGYSIESGRVLMLVLHLLSTLLIFGIARKLTKDDMPAVVAVLIFSLSPVALTYQRRVLLDNLQSFWTLLAFFLILGERRNLTHYVGSAVAFSIAFLSKETAVFFTPAMLFTIFAGAQKGNRWFAIILWLGICFIMGLSYPLYALLNGEFFPYGTALGGSTPHVSLLETLRFQFGRPGGFFLNSDSSFMITFRGLTGGVEWPADPFLIGGGIVCMGVVTLLSAFVAKLRPLALMTICYALLYIRGGIVIDFYIVPIIPFFALCIGFAAYWLARAVQTILPTWLPKRAAGYAAASLCLVPASPIFASTIVYNYDQTTAQREAVAYVQQNIPHDAFILIDNYAFLDFYGTYENAHYYWKIDGDPAINSLIDGNWCNIDYLLTSPQMTYDAYNQGLSIVNDALVNSEMMQGFYGDGRHFEVRRVTPQDCPAEGQSVALLQPQGATVRR
jgi:4-amino-4-deoxy-L-arabinose transferase-like glycosyltransferase